jgi:hypothetical protein
MSAARPPDPGRTRTCPHCKSTILESADVCPACHHHLRFGADRRSASAPTRSAFRVEGVIANQEQSSVWEYTVVVALLDAQGAEIAREVVHVGALAPSESRKCVVSVDVRPVAVATNDRHFAKSTLGR